LPNGQWKLSERARKEQRRKAIERNFNRVKFHSTLIT
jgi:hypothetical protein